jgi:hypothetical protein
MKLCSLFKLWRHAVIDTTALKAAIDALSAKVDERRAAEASKDARIADLEAQLAAIPPAADQQAAIDAVAAEAEAILAKLN